MNIKHSLPDEFFREEDMVFTVDAETKRIWAVLIDLLAEFDRVCRKYGIKYSIDGGTMLGKVRHNGMIPWDDDIDVIILRSEYEKLLMIADKEFTNPYFFQTMQSDPEAVTGHPRLRNSSTTAILKSESKNGKAAFRTFNQGIFMDIFVLDAIPDDINVRKKYCSELVRWKELMWRIRWVRHETLYWSLRPSRFLRLCCILKERLSLMITKIRKGKDPLIFCQEEFDKACRRYENAGTKFVSHLLFMPDPPANRIVERSKILEVVDVDFMGLKVPMLKEWDYYLTLIYGNWHKYVIGATQHGGCIFDVDHPYTDYFDSL